MMLVLYITIALLGLYGLLFLFYYKWWRETPDHLQTATEQNRPIVTVIIPARNEEQNIKACLQSLLEQDYPKNLLEIIVVNDHSEDHTAESVLSFNDAQIKLINLAEENIAAGIAPKKRAIETAIAASKGSVIVSTDADCQAGRQWIAALISYHQQSNAVFVAAPVRIQARENLISKFQALDFLTMQGITAGSVYKRFHNMCNGANLAYEKKVFEEVGGFSGVDNIASGDDMLLMSKIGHRYPERINFLKSEEAIVTTQPVADWSAFFQQRIRWASKATHYKDPVIFWVLMMVYFTNLSVLLFFFAGFADYRWWIVFFGFCMLKFLLEISFVRSVAAFFKQEKLLPYLLLLQPLHIFYIVVSGFLGQVKTYTWKGRKLK